MIKRAVSLFLIFIVFISVFAACSKKDGSGADLVYPIDYEPKSLDPQIAAGKDAGIVISNCFEGLVRLNAKGEIIPGVALNWDVSSDGLEYTFHLRKNAGWHLISGHEDVLGDNYKKTFVTAYDFVYAFRRAVTPLTGSPTASSLFMIKNAEKINSGAVLPELLGAEAFDDHTLKITLAHSSAGFLELLTTPVCMPCNEVFFTATKGRYGLEDDYLLCNGPFYLSIWAHDSSLSLLKNEKDYKGDSEVSPNSVKLSINPDTELRAQKLLQNAYSAAPLTAGAAAALGADSGITLTANENITWSFCFNCSDSALSNMNIRLALCKAIEKNALAPGLAGKEKTDFFIPPCCAAGQSPFSELAKDVRPVNYDLEGAKTLWNKGFTELGANQVSAVLICPPEYETDMRGLLQAWQKTFGIKFVISIEVIKTTELQKRVASGNYQIAFAPVLANKSQAAGFLRNFGSGSADNILRYKSIEYDSILARLDNTTDAAELVQVCEQAQNNLLQSGAVYPVFHQTSYFALAKGVSGIYSTPAGESVYFIEGKNIN